MKVSVLILTYNQENFIAQAIDSALMQQVDFDYEIVIGEDCSADRTREIVRQYAENYPDKINPLFQPQNLNKGNFVATFKACQGQYIALLDGDDYWTSPHKLQKQVDFLDNHPECAMCFHNVTLFYEDGSREPWNRCPVNQKEISTIEDLLKGNFISTCSVMFRNGLFGEFPELFYKTAIGDWPLHILNAQYGNIGYINEVMGAQRIHSGGVWWPQRQDQKLYLETIIEMYKHINTHLNYKYDRLIKTIVSKHYYDLAVGYANSGDLDKARIYAKRYAVEYLSHKYGLGRKLFKLLLMLYVPVLYKLVRTLRNHIRPITNR